MHYISHSESNFRQNKIAMPKIEQDTMHTHKHKIEFAPDRS